MSLDNPNVHGYGYMDRGWANPKRILTCEEEARPGYTSKKAHEYEDAEEVLNEKVKELVNLMRNSRQNVLYTGAGISTAAGLGDYASSEKSEQNVPTPGSDASTEVAEKPPRLRSLYEAQPTKCHRVLTETCHKKFNLIQCWIQQNHDGLPQKAGFPQYLMNEIHGSWYDPSNPVIMMSGTLRTDLFENLCSWEAKASFVLALGTSLCGMNADRVCEAAWRRHTEKQSKEAISNPSSGLVLCNLQETVYDNKCVLRIYCNLEKLASILERLLNDDSQCNKDEQDMIFVPYDGYYTRDEMNALIEKLDSAQITESEEDVFHVPYDGVTGKRLAEKGELLRLDLREDAMVKLTGGQYEGDEGEVVGKQLEGHYKIRFKHLLKPGAKLKMPFERVLGKWWVEQAVKGLVEQIPIVNV